MGKSERPKNGQTPRQKTLEKLSELEITLNFDAWIDSQGRIQQASKEVHEQLVESGCFSPYEDESTSDEDPGQS